MNKFSCYLAIPAIALLTGCGSDDDDMATKVSYKSDIKPIFDVNCAGCHNTGGIAKNSNVFLTNYSETKLAVGLTRNGKNLLLGSIKHEAGINPMPPSPAPKLSAVNINKIEDWIKAGAPDN